MDWLLLSLLLLCPLMMLFCMKGMFTGHKDSKITKQMNDSQQEIQQLQIKMAELMEQNQKLMREIEYKGGATSNVVDFEQQKRVLS